MKATLSFRDKYMYEGEIWQYNPEKPEKRFHPYAVDPLVWTKYDLIFTLPEYVLRESKEPLYLFLTIADVDYKLKFR